MASPRRTRSRTRRSSEDIRARILEASRELFLEQGLEATTTRQIADRAEVAEPLLFSNFGSKTDLFDVAVVAPVAEFVETYAASLGRDGDMEPRDRAEQFVEGLYALVRENRAVLLTALVRKQHRAGSGEPDVVDHLARTLQGLRGLTDLEQYPDVDGQAAVAAGTAMVLGAALLDDLLFPSGVRRPSHARLTAEMTKLLLYGTTRRDAPGD